MTSSVETLLASRANEAKMNWNFDDTLRLAAKHGRYDIVAPLLQVAALLRPLAELIPLKKRQKNQTNTKGRTALHIAAKYGHDNLIPLLLSEDLRLRDCWSNTAAPCS